MTDTGHYTGTRRTMIVAGFSGLIGISGCLEGATGGGPESREFTLTIIRTDEQLELQIEPEGEVADVITISVGDTVEFMIINDTEVSVGFHNHATDAEIVLDPGEDRDMAFEATEAMTGRQELEGWIVETEDSGGSTHDTEATSLAVIEVRPRGS